MTQQNWTVDNIPDQTGRVAVITGANSGIGLETARELCRKGALVVMACRSPDKAQTAADDIRATVEGARLELRTLNLADLSSVRTFAAEVADVVDTAIAQVAEEIGERPSVRQMGLVMKAATAIAAGKADGSRLSSAVKDRL